MWNFCKRCYYLHSSDKPRTLYVTSCGQMICDLCLKQKNSSERVCRCTPDCRLIDFDQLSPEHCFYLKDSKDVVANFKSQFGKVNEFQGQHQDKLVSFYNDQIGKVGQTENDLQQQKLVNQKMQTEIGSLKAQLDQLQRKEVQVQKERNALLLELEKLENDSKNYALARSAAEPHKMLWNNQHRQRSSFTFVDVDHHWSSPPQPFFSDFQSASPTPSTPALLGLRNQNSPSSSRMTCSGFQNEFLKAYPDNDLDK